MGRARVTISSAILLSALALAPGARAQDSLRVMADLGMGYDLTNEIFYEQTFDSTAITGRHTVSDPQDRVQGLSLLTLRGARGGASFAATNDLRAGDVLLRDLTRLSGRQELGGGFRLQLDGDHDARRDRSFDQLRQDRRFGFLTSERYATPDLAWSVRVFQQWERQRSARGAVRLFPDYDYRRVGLDLDRFSLGGGDASLSYAYGARDFPDTSARNYHEHALGGRGRTHLRGIFEIDGWADAVRRSALEDSAAGDRFLEGEGQLRLTAHPGERWEWGALAGIQATRYDAPTTAYFNTRLFRYAAFARLEPTVERAFELGPELELLRAPDFGGIPDGSPAGDLLLVAREEYDQGALRAVFESLGRRTWASLEAGAGRRNFFEDVRGESDLSGHSDYWFVELSGFYDRRLAGGLRLRANGDGRAEVHRVATDNLQSLFLSTELRRSF